MPMRQMKELYYYEISMREVYFIGDGFLFLADIK